ncbi:hypothetical protein EGJ51_17980 [Pseudomonas fulva]|uniref:hypothetical protein n=1 Tax=Pseudomonas fulva TaxID=47880 RepID=UPI000F7AC300|nr:hypothetical protein [Pseudomonas fulva]RRW59527.1 hypothetical protein EGJ51_17980 [Pseudomonas fulva]
MKYHYYLFTFQETQSEHVKHVAVSMGVPDQRVTNKTLMKARAGAGVSPGAVALNVCYLGHMTIEEFNEAEA